jgi:hypothetical protein
VLGHRTSIGTISAKKADLRVKNHMRFSLTSTIQACYLGSFLHLSSCEPSRLAASSICQQLYALPSRPGDRARGAAALTGIVIDASVALTETNND